MSSNLSGTTPLVKTSNPLCGDFFLVHISGFTGVFIDGAQRLVGSGSYFTHAGIVGPDGQVAIAAQPGGAVQTSLTDALDGRTRVAYSNLPLVDENRAKIWSAAQHYLGTPYSFADYAAIAGIRLFHTDSLERYVMDTGHMICSQLVAQCYSDAGIKLFPNRSPGDVAPGDLANLIGAK